MVRLVQGCQNSCWIPQERTRLSAEVSGLANSLGWKIGVLSTIVNYEGRFKNYNVLYILIQSQCIILLCVIYPEVIRDFFGCLLITNYPDLCHADKFQSGRRCFYFRLHCLWRSVFHWIAFSNSLNYQNITRSKIKCKVRRFKLLYW